MHRIRHSCNSCSLDTQNPGTRDRENGEISDENQSACDRGESFLYLFRRGWGGDHSKKSSFSDFQMEVGKGMKTDWGISLMDSYLPGTHLAKEGSGRLASSGLTDNASVGCLSGSGAEENCRGVACRLSQ